MVGMAYHLLENSQERVSHPGHAISRAATRPGACAEGEATFETSATHDRILGCYDSWHPDQDKGQRGMACGVKVHEPVPAEFCQPVYDDCLW